MWRGSEGEGRRRKELGGKGGEVDSGEGESVDWLGV